MSVYGDMLSVFPELMKEIQIFSMEPSVGGGYSNRTPLFKKTGCFIRASRSHAGIQGEARVTNEAGTLYCKEFSDTERVAQGLYFEEDNQIFVVSDDQTFTKEAGFAAYGCQIVQGLTDKQVENFEVETRAILDFPI